MNPEINTLAIQAAVQHLKKSDKGRAAIRDLHTFLRNAGCALDTYNQRAVLTLLHGAFGAYPGTVLEKLEDAGGTR
jgi:hypothetical protein